MNNFLKFVALMLALAGGYSAQDVASYFSAKPRSVDLADYCLLSTEPCQQQQASMTLSVDTLQPLAAATLTVDWPQSSATQLVLSLTGVEMEMGNPKYILQQVSPGHYVGELVLPVCTSDSMTWAGELSDGQHTLYPAMRMQR
ncbi:hypothetical protein AUQ44_17880 [Vibrio cidicii]|uniref:Uncharacterized protein n=1 Tax=Vibrio cidicii TaxID=1763883 RepID=A0A151JDG4_9VIBR|nr:hypothetical protein [Vibrio cidicii]KYN23768.1 hypothetical protein AUQ44_17880 [Vibrio cidicii]